MNVNFYPTGLFKQSRCTLEGWNGLKYDHLQDVNPSTQKQGIRCYSFITSLILRIFGKIHIEKTVDGKHVYLNKKSFTHWKQWRGFEMSPITTSFKSNNVKSEDVEEEANEVDQAENGLSLAAESFISFLSEKSTDDMVALWKALLSNIPPEAIIGFNQADDGTYTLKFNRSFSLWLNTRTKDRSKSKPKGGTIILIGHQKREITFSIPHQRTIKFHSGMSIWCDTKIGVRAVDIINLNDKDEKNFDVDVNCKIALGISKKQTDTHKKRPFTKAWREATFLHEDQSYKEFLKQKMALEN